MMEPKYISNVIAEILDEYFNRLKYRWLTGTILSFILINHSSFYDVFFEESGRYEKVIAIFKHERCSYIWAILLMIAWVFLLPRLNVYFERLRFKFVETNAIRQKTRQKKFRLSAEKNTLQKELINRKMKEEIEKRSSEKNEDSNTKIAQLNEQNGLLNEMVDRLKKEIAVMKKTTNKKSVNFISDVLSDKFFVNVDTETLTSYMIMIGTVMSMMRSFASSNELCIDDMKELVDWRKGHNGIAFNDINKIIDELKIDVEHTVVQTNGKSLVTMAKDKIDNMKVIEQIYNNAINILLGKHVIKTG